MNGDIRLLGDQELAVMVRRTEEALDRNMAERDKRYHLDGWGHNDFGWKDRNEENFDRLYNRLEAYRQEQARRTPKVCVICGANLTRNDGGEWDDGETPWEACSVTKGPHRGQDSEPING